LEAAQRIPRTGIFRVDTEHFLQVGAPFFQVFHCRRQPQPGQFVLRVFRYDFAQQDLGGRFVTPPGGLHPHSEFSL
jgi:hypothetical protein